MARTARDWLRLIHALPLSRSYAVMNVCGGHERSISHAGLRAALPANIELIPGPGCPVCVCPEEDIYQAIQLALREDLILAAFGDMLRVPVNVPKRQPRSLEQARAAGADVRAVSSPTDAVRLAERHPQRRVVFFAAGFETTMAPVAAMVAEGAPDNLQILLSGRLTWPAVALLLATDTPGFDALLAPGHVATVMGPEQWQFVVDRHAVPAAVAGFDVSSLLAGIYSVLRQLLEQRCFLDNCYRELVRPGGNPTARRWLDQIMDVVPANWRGIGTIPASGYALNPTYARLDARRHYPGYDDADRKRIGQMPPGCDCARVVLGQIRPSECVLYDRACTPRTPVGPCMVSDEGACRIWQDAGRRRATPAAAPPG